MRYFYLILLLIGLGISALGNLTNFVPFLLYNSSPSLPEGFYIKVHKPLERGDVVSASLPDRIARISYSRSYLKSSVSIMKPVIGIMGDRVCRDKEVIYVNGQRIGRALRSDNKNRPMPSWRGCYTLGRREVFLFSNYNTKSFDGRYFGPLQKHYIQGIYIPIGN